MNWGHKITIVIVAFLIGMLGMVYYSSLQSNEMIDDHYYEKEIQYQSVIDAQKNLMNVSSASLMDQNKEAVIITFPAGTYEKLNQGTIELLRNDAQSKDVRVAIETNGTNRQEILKTSLSKGIYKARIKWTNDQKAYYWEDNLYVN